MMGRRETWPLFRGRYRELNTSGAMYLAIVITPVMTPDSDDNHGDNNDSNENDGGDDNGGSDNDDDDNGGSDNNGNADGR